MHFTVLVTQEGERGPPPLTFFLEKKREKRNYSKQELLKGCHQGQKVTVLAILERLQFKNFSCRIIVLAGSTFQCSMVPPSSYSYSFKILLSQKIVLSQFSRLLFNVVVCNLPSRGILREKNFSKACKFRIKPFADILQNRCS